MKEYYRSFNEYANERHNNAIDLGLIYLDGDRYELPAKWQGEGITVNLSASGNQQLQIVKSICMQLVHKIRTEAPSTTNENATNVMRWVAVSERLPEIDTSDKWNSDNKITKDVLCWSKEWGMRFGRYFYSAGFWTINGVTSSNGVIVEYWMDVTPPVV